MKENTREGLLFGLTGLPALLTLTLFTFLPGCDQTVSQAQKTAIATAAQAAKERAAAFNLIKTTIRAKSADDQTALDSLLVLHGKGLNAQAVALDTFVKSIDARGKISQRGLDTIVELQKNAQAWVDDCTALRNHLDLTDDQSKWLDAHIDSLKQQAQKLAEFNTGPPAAQPEVKP